MSEDRLFNYLAGGIEIILTGDINPICEELDISSAKDKDCINIYIEDEEETVTYINHRKKKLFEFMKNTSTMKNRRYILINLLIKDRLKLQAMVSLGFSFEDSLYELYIKDKEPVLHSYS